MTANLPNAQEQPQEPERIRVCIRAGKEDWIGVAYANETADPSAIHEYVCASALAAKDAEIRQVLKRLITYELGDGERKEPHWCDPDDDCCCTDACKAAAALYAKLCGVG